MTVAKFSVVALDCRDPRELARFYQKILGGVIDDEEEDSGWLQLVLESASDIAFQHVPDHEAPSWPDGSPQQAHLDLAVADLDEGEAQVLAVGAVKAAVQPNPERWRVFLDPAGHPFCLVLSGEGLTV